MKLMLYILIMALSITSCKQANRNDKELTQDKLIVEKVEPSKKTVLSPKESTMATIGDAHIHIDYSSPGVRNRIIFGGLLAYDTIWQAGAHNATSIETNKDLIIDGKLLPAGKYGFFTIPGTEEWTIIFNSNWDQHGKDEYSAKQDVLRITVKPIVSEEIIEHLEYSIEKIDKGDGMISLAWEKVTVSFTFKVAN